MVVAVGNFKQDKYSKLALDIRSVILDFANENHLTLVEAIGLLEVVKIELYNEQIQMELEDE
jgi:hypothetical protein